MKKMIGAKLGWHVHAADSLSSLLGPASAVGLTKEDPADHGVRFIPNPFIRRFALLGVIEYGLWFR